MQAQQQPGTRELLSHVVAEMAKAVSERPGETKHQQTVRVCAAAATIVDFRPRDMVETILAGSCVMFHELIVDSVGEMLRGQQGTVRHTARSGIIALNRSLHDNLRRLAQYQDRPAEVGIGALEEPPAPNVPPSDTPAETNHAAEEAAQVSPATPTETPAAETVPPVASTVPVPHSTQTVTTPAAPPLHPARIETAKTHPPGQPGSKGPTAVTPDATDPRLAQQGRPAQIFRTR